MLDALIFVHCIVYRLSTPLLRYPDSRVRQNGEKRPFRMSIGRRQSMWANSHQLHVCLLCPNKPYIGALANAMTKWSVSTPTSCEYNTIGIGKNEMFAWDVITLFLCCSTTLRVSVYTQQIGADDKPPLNHSNSNRYKSMFWIKTELLYCRLA